MAFTQRTITHNFTNADGTPASGAVTFELTKRMSQPGQTIVPGEVSSALDASGNLSQSVAPTNDSGTMPQDALWNVTIRIQGMSPLGPYGCSVPAGSGDLDLYDILPEIAVSND